MATDETEHRGGRGAAAILAAKLIFLVGGYLLVLGVSRSLSTEDFGAYSVINGVTSLFNMIFITGTLQTTSRFVATNPSAADAVRAQLLRYQVVFASVLLGLIFLASPLIASALHDERLTTPLRWASVDLAWSEARFALEKLVITGREQMLKHNVSVPKKKQVRRAAEVIQAERLLATRARQARIEARAIRQAAKVGKLPTPPPPVITTQPVTTPAAPVTPPAAPATTDPAALANGSNSDSADMVN